MSNNDFPDFSAFAVGGDEDGLPDFSDQAVGPKAPDLPIPQKYYDDIKRIEGFSPVAKWDYKQNTNGYGTRALHPGERIDEAEAERRYNREIAKAAASVDSFLPGLPEGVRASLASLTFNSGDKWQRMGLGAALKAGDMEEAGRRFNQYVNADGKPLGGLINRRAEEYQWWRDHQAGDFESKPETDNPDLKALLSASPEKRRELLLNQIENVTGADMSAYRQPKPAAPAPAGPKLDFSDFAVDPGADAPKDNREKPKDKNALPDDQKGVFGDLWGILAPEERVPATKEELASGKSQLEIAKAIKEKTGKALEDFTTDRAKKPESALDWVLRYNPAGLIGDKLTEWGLLGADAAAAARVESQEKRIKGAEDALAGKGPLVSKSGSRAAAEGAIESAATMVPKAIEYYGQLRGYGTQLGQKLRGDEVTAKVEDDAAYKFGKKLEDWLKEKFPGDEARQHQFGQQVAQGVGSTVGFWGPGAITKLLGGGEKAYMAAIALSGIAAQSADVFNEITEKINSGNATENDRIINWLSGIPLGASEALPFAPTIGGPIHKLLGGRVAGALEQGIEESLQEGFQGIGGNYAAQKTYDPERNIMEGVPEGMAVGLITGLGGGAALKNGEAPAQAGQRPAPAAPPLGPQPPQPGAPRAQAPVAAGPSPAKAPVPSGPVGEITPEDIQLLIERGWKPDALVEMGEDELRAEIEDARTQVGTPLAPNAPRQADAPSAEPVSDIEAQILSMRAGERDGVYLSAANVENLQSQPEFVNRIAEALNSAEGAQIVQNVDGNGGVMIAANADVARQVEKAVKAGVDVQTVLGEATGAGTGKPADATAVVQQKTPEGAVTRESLVTPDQVAETEKEFAVPGKTVETVTPEQAIARREEKIAEEKQTGPMVSRVPTFQDIAEELPKDEDGLPNYQALSDRIKEIGKKGWPDLNVMEKAKLYREFAGQGTGTRAAPVTVETADDLELVSNEADSEYTPAQGEANNRKLGHAKWNGLDLSIETKAGGVRKGVDKETGKTWETTMSAAYGYIRGTSGADNMHVDAYVGTDVNSGRVFIIDEVDNKTGKFRQHKTFIGFPDEASAVAAYTGTSSKTPDMIGAVTEMSADEFRDWVLDGKKTKPLGNIEKPDFSSQSVEPETAQPAKTKSEAIAPPARYEGELSEMEIDALVGNWQYVQEVSRRPRPQSLSAYVIDNGGLRDDAREVRHIAGSAKERPGLVNGKGQTLDDAALSAWEAGFFPGDRPEIAEFLNALQDDLHTGEVVREEDIPALDDFRIADEIAQELADYGVTINRFRSEASLREYFGQERPRTARETEADQEAQAPAKERTSRTGDVEEAPFDLPAKGEEKKPFDPYAFSVQAVYAKQGEEALKKRLAEFGADDLKQIVAAQNLGVKSAVLDGGNAIALRKAIVEAAREKLANRMAAAGGTVEGALKKPAEEPAEKPAIAAKPLKHIPITLSIEVTDGEGDVTVRMNAEEAIAMVDRRIKGLNQLLGCLSK